jgi:hypothetical protein
MGFGMGALNGELMASVPEHGADSETKDNRYRYRHEEGPPNEDLIHAGHSNNIASG